MVSPIGSAGRFDAGAKSGGHLNLSEENLLSRLRSSWEQRLLTGLGAVSLCAEINSAWHHLLGENPLRRHSAS
jgi:hypothetical protein